MSGDKEYLRRANSSIFGIFTKVTTHGFLPKLAEILVSRRNRKTSHRSFVGRCQGNKN